MAGVVPRVADPGDIDRIVDTLTTAFLDDPVWGAYSFPDRGRQVEQSTRFWAGLLEPAMRFPWTLVTPGCEAVAVWIPPGEPELTPQHEAVFCALAEEILGREQSGVVLDAFDRLDAAHPHDPPHYYLSLLATHTAHRGNGLGMALLAACLEQVDAEHAPAYLESTNPANNRRYMTLGFEPFGEVALPNGHVITTMWRASR